MREVEFAGGTQCRFRFGVLCGIQVVLDVGFKFLGEPQQPGWIGRLVLLASRRVPLVVEAVFGGVALLAEHPIGLAVAEKHCLPESVENWKVCKPC